MPAIQSRLALVFFLLLGLCATAQAKTIFIDLGKNTQTTGVVNGDTWNNFAPNNGTGGGTVDPADATPDVPNLLFSDGVNSGIDFDLTGTLSSNNQGIGGADWTQDFSGSFGYPVSATRDMFFVHRTETNTFTFSDLLTDGTRYTLTVFGAFNPATADRPLTIINAGGADKSYDPNSPGEVTFANLLPDVSGMITFTARTAGSTSSDYGHISVITLAEASAVPEPATLSLFAVGALALVRRRR